MPDPGGGEIEVLRRIHGSGLSSPELEEISDRFADRYRIQVALIQNPRFPLRCSLNFLSSLFPADLMRVIRNKRANPQLRRRAEQEFLAKFQRFPLGEKLTYVRIAPVELLHQLAELKDTRLLKSVLENPSCTQEVVLKGLLQKGDRQHLYRALDGTRWIKLPAVAAVISRQADAPIRILLAIIPWLRAKDLTRLESDAATHESVLKAIRYRRERV